MSDDVCIENMVTGQDDITVQDMLVSWKRLDLREGDVLAVLVPYKLLYDQMMRLYNILEPLKQTLGVKVVVLDQGTTLAAVRPVPK